MSASQLNYDNLIFRTYLIAAVAYDDIVVPSPCIVDGLISTNVAGAGWIWTIFDGTTPGGGQLFNGAGRAMSITGLRIRCAQGLYLQQSGGAPNGSWIITAAVVPDEFIDG